jgi:hypothetical protein
MRIADDLRRDLDRAAYTAATERLVALCASCGIGRKDLALFGEVGFPGVSDIDALAVGKPDALRRLAALHARAAVRDPDYGYLFWHPPVYVIEAMAGQAGVLHSLEGLRWLAGAGRDLGRPAGDDEGARLLRILWFMFLLKVLLGIRRTHAADQALSLRLLLLVQKNLLHSSAAFAGAGEGMPAGIIAADALRAQAMQQAGDGTQADAIGTLLSAQLSSLTLTVSAHFDRYCADVSGRLPDTPYRLPRTLLFRSVVVRRAGATRIRGVGRMSRVDLNPLAFRLLHDALRGDSTWPPMQSYLRVAGRGRRLYATAGMPYPFINPFFHPESVWKRTLLRLVNGVRMGELL